MSALRRGPVLFPGLRGFPACASHVDQQRPTVAAMRSGGPSTWLPRGARRRGAAGPICRSARPCRCVRAFRACGTTSGRSGRSRWRCPACARSRPPAVSARSCARSRCPLLEHDEGADPHPRGERGVLADDCRWRIGSPPASRSARVSRTVVDFPALLVSSPSRRRSRPAPGFMIRTAFTRSEPCRSAASRAMSAVVPPGFIFSIRSILFLVSARAAIAFGSAEPFAR